MKKRKSTGFALLLSFCSMLLCIVALIGTSFAWFTSTDTVAVNKIRAGTLGIELVDSSGNKLSNGLDFYKTDSNGSVSTDVVWEPGSTYRTKSLYIKNVGDLDVVYKYIVSIPQLAAAVVAEGAETNTEVNQSATLFDSIDFSIVVCDSLATGEGVDPEVCRFLWNKDSYTMEVSEDALNGDNVKWPGEKPTELPDIFSLPAQTVESMQSEGINSRYYIYMEGTMKSDASASVMGAVISGIQITAYAYQSNGNEESGETNNLVTVTSGAGAAEDYSATLTDTNTTYKFVGDFTNINIIITPGLKQTFDGSEANVSGNVTIGYSDISAMEYSYSKATDRNSYIDAVGFKAGKINVNAYDSAVNITKNTVGSINLEGANLKVTALENTIVGGSEIENGFYLYAVGYDLMFNNNTVTGTNGHAIVINGRTADLASTLAVENVSNSIDFKGNSITVSGEANSAMCIINDLVYAPAEPESIETLTESARLLLDSIREPQNNNVINGDNILIVNAFKIANTSISTN